MEKVTCHYAYTIAGTNRDGSVSHWNYVSTVHPVDKLRITKEAEEAGSKTYVNFWIVSMMEIPETVYDENKDKFEN